MLVCIEQRFSGAAEGGFGARANDLSRQVPASLAERLITGAAFLAVPDWFVHDVHRRQDRDLFEAKDQVSEVGNRAMAVLEVERVQELLGTLGAQLLNRLEHALARARVLGQGIRLNFGRDANNRVHPPRRIRAAGWLDGRDGGGLHRQERTATRARPEGKLLPNGNSSPEGNSDRDWRRQDLYHVPWTDSAAVYDASHFARAADHGLERILVYAKQLAAGRSITSDLQLGLRADAQPRTVSKPHHGDALDGDVFAQHPWLDGHTRVSQLSHGFRVQNADLAQLATGMAVTFEPEIRDEVALRPGHFAELLGGIGIDRD